MSPPRSRFGFKRSILFVISSLLLMIFTLILPHSSRQESGSTSFFQVKRVFDGDTFQLSTGEKVRMLGIDTPELHESGKLLRDVQRSGKDPAKIKAMGRRAREYVVPFLEGKKVRLEYDIQQRDKYGRLLAYVYLEDGSLLNRLIIENGFATPLTIPPNVKHADEFKMLYKAARKNKLGLWQDASHEP